ncbi:N-succinylarginine dihydrolase [Rubripirellula lacrimiformis]|uniref:N-succinylarginine dihydrolase n=1 Tax=Rubripirellula lacrimiformis TaxID=1930273 RepID=A0A517N886_9BACT|nr:N-succinylarginine dihydrolase [Rubripirellula lacrimiformis]QDT03357.1 N-succinylarginine dihydrolase [Rubripirellula lacrimiformis]
MSLVEVQIDRLVGPTHHFGGLGVGNLASKSHSGQVSNPAAAAIQGLEKMKLVASLGVPQWVLPPQQRPDWTLLRSLGFAGSDRDVLRDARDRSPELLSAASSSSAMWTANAATVTVGNDGDRWGTDVSIANLSSSLHRCIEWQQTEADLRAILPSSVRVHSPLMGGAAMRDEGAANHMRLGHVDAPEFVDVFVYGDQDPLPQNFMPRQTLASFQAIDRRHQWDRPQRSAGHAVFLKQHPRAIDAGAFHNDVVAISHHDLMIHHQFAFADNDAAMELLDRRCVEVTGRPVVRVQVADDQLTMDEAIATYLFNSQVVSVGADDAPPVMICPVQVDRSAAARGLVDRWQSEGLISRVQFVDLGQSMAGGGGPACLRLRVPMQPEDVDAMSPASRWTPELHDRLCQIIHDGYPKAVSWDELASIDFVNAAKRVRDQVAESLGCEMRS